MVEEIKRFEEICGDSLNRLFKWDNRFLELAKHVAQWSKDPSTQVGAVLVQYPNIVVGLGYNGFPRGVFDTEERLNDRPVKYKFVVHAEVNAILMAGEKARGSTLYVWPSFNLPPICNECCKVAIQAGVDHIVGYTDENEKDRDARWSESILISKAMCDEAGVRYSGVPVSQPREECLAGGT
jgi:dCMP deaminase